MLPQSENLLELVDHEHRCKQEVLSAPQFDVRSVQVFPARFSGGGEPRLGGLDFDGVSDTVAKLICDRWSTGFDIQANVYRQEVLCPERTGKNRTEERGLDKG